jgi:GTPase SAR1 family protein
MDDNLLEEEIYDEPVIQGEMSETSYNIKTWDTKNITDYFTMIIYAKRRSGKSFLVQRFIHDNKDRFDEIYFFSSTADLIPDTEYSFIPNENKFDHLDNSVLEGIMDEQKGLLMESRKKGNKKIKIPHILVVLDDIMTDKSFLSQSSLISKLFVEGRHYHMSCIVIAQNFTGRTGISPQIRKNADYIVTFHQSNQDDLKNLSTQFLSLVSNKEGIRITKSITNEEHQALVIDNAIKGARKYEDYVFKYKAPADKLPKFRIGTNKTSVKTGSSFQKYSNSVYTVPLQTIRFNIGKQ